MEYKYLKKLKFFFLVFIAYGVFIISIYLVINHSLTRIIEHQAVTVAEIVAIQATSARSVYARDIVKKLSEDGFGPDTNSHNLKGYVPIPAQFLKKIGLETSRNTAELFYYRPVSKWNLEPSQGLNNDFLIWAWSELEKQDKTNPTQAINWNPVWRVETTQDGVRYLRYLKADPASSQSCVTCHNQYEKTEQVISLRQQSNVENGKQWKLHQLLGALYVNIPLDKVEAISRTQNRQTIILIILISLLGILVSSLFLRRLFKQSQSLYLLSHEASHDSLTGLVNRRGFERYIDNLYDQAHDNEHSKHVLCLMDLDGFKNINDTYGHLAGDELLIAIAKTLKKNVRSNDIVARLGGDEFAVVLDACPIDKAKKIAHTILNDVHNCEIKFAEHNIHVGISIGLGIIDYDIDSMDETIDAIDSACYAAKKNGKNQIFYVEGEQYRQYIHKDT